MRAAQPGEVRRRRTRAPPSAASCQRVCQLCQAILLAPAPAARNAAPGPPAPRPRPHARAPPARPRRSPALCPACGCSRRPGDTRLSARLATIPHVSAPARLPWQPGAPSPSTAAASAARGWPLSGWRCTTCSASSVPCARPQLPCAARPPGRRSRARSGAQLARETPCTARIWSVPRFADLHIHRRVSAARTARARGCTPAMRSSSSPSVASKRCSSAGSGPQPGVRDVHVSTEGAQLEHRRVRTLYEAL